MCIVDGFQFLAPAGRHVYSSASASEERYVYSSDTLIVRAQRSAMCIVDGCFQFLAPAGRHVYSSASASEERYVYSSDTLIVRAPEERNVYSGWLFPVFSPSGATCL